MPGPMAPQEFGIDYFRGQDQVAKGFEEAGKAWWLRQPVHPLIGRAIQRMLSGQLTPKEAAYHVHAGIQAGADADTVFGPDSTQQPQGQPQNMTQQSQPGSQQSDDDESDSDETTTGGQPAQPTPQSQSGHPSPANMQQASSSPRVVPGVTDVEATLPSGVPGLSQADVTRSMMSRAVTSAPTTGVPPATGRNNLGQMPVLGGMFNALGVGETPPGGGGMQLTNRDLMQIQEMGGLRALGVMSPEERMILQQLKNTGTVGAAGARAGGTVGAAKVRSEASMATTEMRTKSQEQIASRSDETKRQQIQLEHQDRMSAIAASLQRARILAARLSTSKGTAADLASLDKELNTMIRMRQQAISSVNQMPTESAKKQLAQDLQMYDANIADLKQRADAARTRVGKQPGRTTATAKGPSAEDLAAMFGK